MTLIPFVRDYQDLSTDRGYQFKFNCDKCGNGYMSTFQPSLIGTAGTLLQAAGGLFGGVFGSAGNSAYQIQRAIGGPAHDKAINDAITEIKQKFHQCLRCGQWVCSEICWNEGAGQCTACSPKFEQELIASRLRAQASAADSQLHEKALATDYVSNVDMHPDVHIDMQSLSHANTQAPPVLMPSAHRCTSCGALLTGGKFCGECGTAVAPAVVPGLCSKCGHQSDAHAKFCEECGNKLAV